jgi:hypothetical protein
MPANAKKPRPVSQGSEETGNTGGSTQPGMLKENLPPGAFAVASDPGDPETWLAPHHVLSGFDKAGREGAVDWRKMEECVGLLSRQGLEGRRLSASPEIILAVARHLAGHYTAVGRPLPDALAVLV